MSNPAQLSGPLNADNPGDMLAMVTSTYGYTPTNSMVIIGFQPVGNSGGHLRMDLDPALNDPAMVADRFGPFFAEDHDACAVLVFGPVAPTPGHEGQPSREAEALAVLDAGLEVAGVPVVSSFQYGAGYVRPLRAPGEDTAPFPGDLIAVTSQAAYELTPETEHTPADTVARYTTAEADPRTADHIDQAEVHAAEGLMLADAIASGETPADTLTGTGIAALLAALTHDTPALIATAATDLTGAFRVITSDPPVTGIPELADSTGPAPDWAGIDRIADALAVAAGYATGPTAANLYAVMGWIEWAKGSGSTAVLFIDQARRLDATNTTAAGLSHMAALGPSRWAEQRETAYRPTR